MWKQSFWKGLSKTYSGRAHDAHFCATSLYVWLNTVRSIKHLANSHTVLIYEYFEEWNIMKRNDLSKDIYKLTILKERIIYSRNSLEYQLLVDGREAIDVDRLNL